MPQKRKRQPADASGSATTGRRARSRISQVKPSSPNRIQDVASIYVHLRIASSLSRPSLLVLPRSRPIRCMHMYLRAHAQTTDDFFTLDAKK